MRLGLGISIPGTSGLVQAAFSPLDLSPVLWLDASDTSTITEVGGAVSQWDDKSGNGNDVAQGTAAAQPTSGTRTINSLNVLDFDGNDGLRTSAADIITQPNTVFMVLEHDTVNTQLFFDSYDANDRTTFYVSGGLAGDPYVVSAGANLTGSASSTGTPQIFRLVFDGASSSLTIDAGTPTTGNAGSNSFGLISVGTRYSDI